MRVLHLDSGRDLRGGQRQILTLWKGLQTQGVEQEILCRGELQGQTEGGELGAFRLWSAAKRADVIHAHDARAHTLAAIFGRGKPLVVSRRVAFPIRRGVLSRWKYRRATLFLAVSEFVRDRLAKAGVPDGRIRVVPDGVPVPQPLPPVREASKQPLTVIPVATDHLKCVPLARRACDLSGMPLKLSSDLAADLPAADFFLYLSKSEGLGSALILAAMHGKPTVASRVGGIPEIVLDEETGLLARNDPNEIARALDRLRGDPALARRLAGAAQARAVRDFSDDKMIARTLEAYRSVLSVSASP